MLHQTMLDDVGPTCWLRLNRPLETKELLPIDQLVFSFRCQLSIIVKSNSYIIYLL